MCGFPADFSVKKIEAIIDPEALDAVKLHLAQGGIDWRLTVTEVSGLENLGRFYQHEPATENPWKPCFRIDLIVADRQMNPRSTSYCDRLTLQAGEAPAGILIFSLWMQRSRLALKNFFNLPKKRRRRRTGLPPGPDQNFDSRY